MKTIKAILLLVLLVLGTNLSSSAQEGSKAPRRISPDTLVAALYKQHAREQSPFFQTTNRVLVDRYFERDLADLIWKDAIDANGEVGAIEADPLYDAQDTDIKKFAVHRPSYADGRATVIVSFENFGQKNELLFLLVSKKADWKIADIKYKNGTTLRGILKGGAGSEVGGSHQEHFFEGRSKVGNTSRTVKPAFEVSWAKGTGAMIFFFDSAASAAHPVYTSEHKASATDKFTFVDEHFESGGFIRSEGEKHPVGKINRAVGLNMLLGASWQE